MVLWNLKQPLLVLMDEFIIKLWCWRSKKVRTNKKCLLADSHNLLRTGPAHYFNILILPVSGFSATFVFHVTTDYTKGKDQHCGIWNEVYLLHGLDPFIKSTHDPIPYLEVLGTWYNDGQLSVRDKALLSWTVSDEIYFVGQMFDRMGSPDLQYHSFGNINYNKITSQFQSYIKKEWPPKCVYFTLWRIHAGQLNKNKGNFLVVLIILLLCRERGHRCISWIRGSR